MSEDRRPEAWSKTRDFVERVDIMTVEEAAGALLQLLDIDGPEGMDDPPTHPAAQLLRNMAICLLVETRWRYDQFPEIVEGG